MGAVIQGARAPIVLTSRADSAESKLYSLALAILSTAKIERVPTKEEIINGNFQVYGN